ncbi:SON protein [Paenibacillus sp. M1]|uniref:SON protein n=1 Tax=Paenibacillus haidiansis TaxID=1574488 RepID=A0ABU7VPJ2_9BACL
MIAECKEYLISKLKQAGIKSEVRTSMKSLKAYQDSHVGAVIPEGDVFARASSKKAYFAEDGSKHKRRKLYDRTMTFTVVIGEYDQEKCDRIFSSFMASLDTGIYIDGNYTAIEVEEADWVDKDDSIIAAKIAVQLKVKFLGGIYKDTDFAPVTDYNVQSIEQVKEDVHGSE